MASKATKVPSQISHYPPIQTRIFTTMMSANRFKDVANQVLRTNPNRTNKSQLKTFVGKFGTTPDVAAELWLAMNPVAKLHPKSEPKHLLWALLFLFHYDTESNNCAIVGINDEKTFRKWCWIFVAGIVSLEKHVIRWENRFINYNGTAKCLVLIDGTDCHVNEPYPFDTTTMFSQKFKGSGYKYEVAVAIRCDKICNIVGPEKAGVSDKLLQNYVTVD